MLIITFHQLISLLKNESVHDISAKHPRITFRVNDISSCGVFFSFVVNITETASYKLKSNIIYKY